MVLYELLASSPNKDTLRSRVDILCKGRSFGDSLTPLMLYCILEAMENRNDDDFGTDVAAIKEEIRIMEDSRSINERKRAYGIHLLMEKTKLPLPAKMRIATGFLRVAPRHQSSPSRSNSKTPRGHCGHGRRIRQKHGAEASTEQIEWPEPVPEEEPLAAGFKQLDEDYDEN